MVNPHMLPDLVPMRTVHHRYIVLKKPTSLAPKGQAQECKDKGTWRCKYKITIYVVNTGETVYEKNNCK